jgi:YVTN family beta-propeller protein
MIVLIISCGDYSSFKKVFAFSNSLTTQERPRYEIAALQVGEIPTDICINPKTNLLYVANTGSNFISVINGNINKVIYNIARYFAFCVAFSKTNVSYFQVCYFMVSGIKIP